jgi:O-antigen/teichoic acid export membrane protein
MVIRDFLQNYIQAIPVLETLAVTLIFRVVNIPLNNTVLAFGQFTLITYVALLNLAIISILLFYCVPTYGIQGAAISLLVGEAINTAIHLVIINRIFVMQRRTILP